MAGNCARSIRSAGLAMTISTALGAAASMAQAQWTVTILHHPVPSGSLAWSVSAGHQAGFAYVLGEPHASLWSGTSASWVDLNPAGAIRSFAYGVSGTQQAGAAEVNGIRRACLWSGTSASWVDLNPADSVYSTVYGIAEGQQVGFAEFGADPAHASLWTGSAESWLDLHPAAASMSVATCVSGGKQGGYANVGGNFHASMWSGTATSWMDINPSAAASSYLAGMADSQQVGAANVGGVEHASLWAGSPESWVDLHPPSAEYSMALGASGGQQVGSVSIGGNYHASLWTGTAASWIDLHALLPSAFTSSTAQGIWTDGCVTYIVGSGNTGSGTQAILWAGMFPAAVRDQPLNAVVCRGTSTTLSLTATGAATYQWQGEVNQLPGYWVDIADGELPGIAVFSGASTPSLTISSAAQSAGGRYRCIVANPCGGVTSQPATLAVRSCDCLIADITGIGGPPSAPDGLVTGDDFIWFTSAFALGNAAADITGIGGPPAISDGLITGDDFNAFISAFAAGCP